jgi:hypothetical protein
MTHPLDNPAFPILLYLNCDEPAYSISCKQCPVVGWMSKL